MNRFIFSIAAALMLGVPASAATVSLVQNQDIRVELHGVSSASFEFTLPADSPWYSNFGGYLKWSSRLDGRQDSDGDWGVCFECGTDAGSWALASDGLFKKTVTVNFGATLDSAYVWLRASWGKGSVSYASAVAPASQMPAVPLPGAAALLAGALVGLGAFKKRRKPA